MSTATEKSPMTNCLYHVTLATGHLRESHRQEIGDDILSIIQRLLEDALARPLQHVPIPELNGYTVTVTMVEPVLIVSVFGPWDEAADAWPGPVVTFGVAPLGSGNLGEMLWRVLHESHLPLETRCDEVAPEPWVAVRLESAAPLFPEALEWLGDFERCVGWAWLERQATRH